MSAPRRPLPPAVPVLAPLLAALLLAGALGGCAPAGAGGPVAAVGEEEARAVVAGVVALAAQRTPAAMERVCEENDGCPGMSSGIVHDPLGAPGPERAPRELCTVAVPPTPSQDGSRIVVLEGVDGYGRAYVSQVLVDRAREAEDDEDGLQVQEPGFWLGIRYTALQHGRAWSGLGTGPGQPGADDDLARRACTDTRAWVAEVATRTPDEGATARASREAAAG
ncbi:hypothetical protein [Kineococcus gypseus]|uniref:hypothetical protein n=1 Tax=Kineococcus gypseus TaxID=1637102 RepID=UPI003D7E973A